MSPNEIGDPDTVINNKEIVDNLLVKKHMLFERMLITKNGHKIPNIPNEFTNSAFNSPEKLERVIGKGIVCEAQVAEVVSLALLVVDLFGYRQRLLIILNRLSVIGKVRVCEAQATEARLPLGAA